MLTGKEIAKQVWQGRIKIEPFNLAQCNPNSYDYRLGPSLWILRCNSEFDGVACIDPRLPQKCSAEFEIPKSGYLLKVGQAYIGATLEKFGSDYYPGLVTGKSSIGRLFMTNHYCADHVDQGFFGHVTIEITVEMPTLIFPNMLFGQIRWLESAGECELYCGKYQNNEGALPSLLHQDFK